jgi:hypothetical protein
MHRRPWSARSGSSTVIATLVASALALAGCAQGGIDETGDETAPGDEAAASPENPSDDAAVDPATDSGTPPPADAGTPKPPADSSAPPPVDSGAPKPPVDSGTPPPPPVDSGTPPPPIDSGTPPPVDAGATSFDYASGLAVSEIAVLQGVKVSVWRAGAVVTAHNAPVVQGRAGLVRVYVTPQAGWSGKSVTARLTLTSAGVAQTYTDTKTPTAASTDASLTSTFDFDLGADAFAADTTASVALTVAKGSGSASAGSAAVSAFAIAAENPGSTLKVVLVPVKYNADGSGRLPDTSSAQLALYQQTLMKLYPARSISITVHAPLAWSSTISASGAGFSTVLSSLATLRSTDKAPADTYYYASFSPTSSFNTYCGSGCVTGLSTVASSATDSFARTSSGLGFTGVDSAYTMAHELGHAHGRNHAPTTSGNAASCMTTSSADASYPYASGLIGSWGYDTIAKTLFAPTGYGDVMGYCDKAWVSDYTYRAFFTRMRAVTGGASIVYPANAPTKFHIVAVAADGALSWGEDVEPVEPPVGELTTLHYTSEDGTVVTTATGHYYPYSDLPGGLLLVPELPVTGWQRIVPENPAFGAHVLMRAAVR